MAAAPTVHEGSMSSFNPAGATSCISIIFSASKPIIAALSVQIEGEAKWRIIPFSSQAY
ncbi:uncharacterized protein METZ01_LOCUS293088 [marine metagenome]|uniref:Uncharacterized protein n=1 Tax=marine metagenome TaxID=408172 RepID=A0A382LU24_9ZZZZ